MRQKERRRNICALSNMLLFRDNGWRVASKAMQQTPVCEHASSVSTDTYSAQLEGWSGADTYEITPFFFLPHYHLLRQPILHYSSLKITAPHWQCCKIKRNGMGDKRKRREVSKEKDHSHYQRSKSNVQVNEWRVYVRMDISHDSQEYTLSPH